MSNQVKAKKVRVGALWVKQNNKDGRTWTSRFLGLGNGGNKDPKYNTTLELVVRDSTGKVIHTQKDGFISLSDPRTQPDELLAAGSIDEAKYNKMKAGTENLPDELKYNLEITLK